MTKAEDERAAAAKALEERNGSTSTGNNIGPGSTTQLLQQQPTRTRAQALAQPLHRASGSRILDTASLPTDMQLPVNPLAERMAQINAKMAEKANKGKKLESKREEWTHDFHASEREKIVERKRRVKEAEDEKEREKELKQRRRKEEKEREKEKEKGGDIEMKE